MNGPVIRIQNAHKYYNQGRSNELHVMNGISLAMQSTGLVAIFGRSGCGKTTLLNVLGGLDTVGSGTVELFGQNIRTDTDTLRNRYVGYIFQNYNLNEADTVYENVAAALRLCGMTDEQEISTRVVASLKNVGMEKYVARTPDTLSGGQQQRVAIARALVKNPAIILADEPTGNLDEANTVLVMDILKEISKTHLVLLVTHEAYLVDYYCDRIIELVDGSVASDRANEGASGYVRRNKNDIYLGELEKRETSVPGVTLAYYGEPTDAPIGLSIVRVAGKLYLKCDDPSVKLLDDSSEIRLRDGVFDPAPPPTEDGENHNGHTIDMSALTPVEGKHYGRLYHPKNAFAGAWREYFSKKTGRRRKGRGLRVVLILIAVVLAIMSATFGVGIKAYAEIAEEHNEHLFYIPLDPEVDYSGLDIGDGHNGVQFSRVVGSYPLNETDPFNVNTAAFMTANQISLSGEGRAQSADHIPSDSLVAGVDTITSTDEMIITTAVADKLIEASTVGYIDGYEDFVGMRAQLLYGGIGEPRIVGVVESSEFFYYLHPVKISQLVLWQYAGGYNATAISQTGIDVDLAEGEMVYIWWSYEGDESVPPYSKGDRVTVMGKTVTVQEVMVCDYEDRDTLGMNGTYGFVLHDTDFAALAYSVDKPADGSGTPFYQLWTYLGEVEYSNHLLLRSDDPSATKAHLTEVLGEAGFITPEEVLAESLASARSGMLTNALIMLLFVALMCLCVFFIMRSAFMGRVREVGILRAIGVSRKNLLFRFAVETVLLLLLTTVVAYLCTTAFIFSLSDAPLFSSVFFFPPWLATLLLLIICAAGFFFGLLPGMLLLRKTPSEILSKYDI